MSSSASPNRTSQSRPAQSRQCCYYYGTAWPFRRLLRRAPGRPGRTRESQAAAYVVRPCLAAPHGAVRRRTASASHNMQQALDDTRHAFRRLAQDAELSVKRIFCVSSSLPALPFELADASRTEAELEEKDEKGNLKYVRVGQVL